MKGNCAFAPGAISPFVLTSSKTSQVLSFSLGHGEAEQPKEEIGDGLKGENWTGGQTWL